MNEDIGTPQPRFGERMSKALRSFFIALIRLIVIVLAGTILGLVIYLGVPWVYRQLVEPVQENAAQIEALRVLHRQDQDLVNQRVARLTTRIETLEKLADLNKEAIAELEGQFNSQLEDANNQLLDLSNESISTNEDLVSIKEQLRKLDTASTSLSQQINSVSELLRELQEERTRDLEPLDALSQHINLLKVMELLTRSQLYLAQNNLGSAEDEVQVAREEMVMILTRAHVNQVEVMREIVTRLDLALENLPAAPELAVVDLDAAWRLIARNITDQSGQPISGGETIPAPTGAATLPATPAQLSTPTPGMTVTPTP